MPPEEAAPLYVRDKVAFTTAERMAGQGGNPRAASQMAAAAACVPSVVEASSASAPDVPEAPGVGAPAEAQSVDSSGAAQPVEVQPMTAADLDDIADLEARVQAFPWTRGNFADGLAAGYPGCVLRQDGRLAGFCVLMLAPDVAHLLVIAVQPALHRRGLGNRLLAWCEGRASQAGLPGILLEVRPSNPGALRFYERAGYLKVGVRKGYYPSGNGKREDALVMYKSIARSGE